MEETAKKAGSSIDVTLTMQDIFEQKMAAMIVAGPLKYKVVFDIITGLSLAVAALNLIFTLINNLMAIPLGFSGFLILFAIYIWSVPYVIAPSSQKKNAKQAFLQMEEDKKSYQVVFDPNGYTVFYQNSSMVIPWNWIYKVAVTKSQIVILIERNKGITIPRRFINDNDFNKITKLLKSECKERYKTLR
jgi:hypothetical protein